MSSRHRTYQRARARQNRSGNAAHCSPCARREGGEPTPTSSEPVDVNGRIPRFWVSLVLAVLVAGCGLLPSFLEHGPELETGVVTSGPTQRLRPPPMYEAPRVPLRVKRAPMPGPLPVVVPPPPEAEPSILIGPEVPRLPAHVRIFVVRPDDSWQSPGIPRDSRGAPDFAGPYIGPEVEVGELAPLEVDYSGPATMVPRPELPVVADGSAPPRAFPGASGYGAEATLACNRDSIEVIHVTNLLDGAGNTGSVDWAMSQTRVDTLDIIVVDTAGKVLGEHNDDGDCYYFAGQTSSGDGLRFIGRVGLGSDTNNDVIWRSTTHESDAVAGTYFQGGMSQGYYTELSIHGGSNDMLQVYLDTAQASSTTKNNFTIAYNIVGPSVGGGRGIMCKGWDPNGSYVFFDDCDIHHNFLAQINVRGPLLGAQRATATNNITYGVNNRWAEANGNQVTLDYVSNMFKSSPLGKSSLRPIALDEIDPPDTQLVYVEGNVAVDLNETALWAGSQMNLLIYKSGAGVPGADTLYLKKDTANTDANVPLENILTAGFGAGQLFDVLLDSMPAITDRFHVGNWWRLACDGTREIRRSPNDSLLIRQAHQGTGDASTPTGDIGNYGGWIDPTDDVGTPCADTDGDGMFDDFEDLYPAILDKTDATDFKDDPDGDGWTNIEEFLNVTTPDDSTSGDASEGSPPAADPYTYNGPIRVYFVSLSEVTFRGRTTLSYPGDSIDVLNTDGRWCANYADSVAAYITEDSLETGHPFADSASADSELFSWPDVDGCSPEEVRSDPIPGDADFALLAPVRDGWRALGWAARSYFVPARRLAKTLGEL